MSIKVINKSFGKEVIVSQEFGRIVRLYYNENKKIMTVDWSQCRDKKWDKKAAVLAKYGDGNIKVTVEKDVFEKTCKWFNS